MWTRFRDMHSGGDQKEKQQYIYIEAPEDVAKIVFYNRFDHNPYRVTCSCCGPDYSIDEEETLENLTAYNRGCDYSEGKYVDRPSTMKYSNSYQTLEEYSLSEAVLIIRKEDIKPEEYEGEVPSEGYVWM